MAVKPIPQGMENPIPYLAVADSAAAIDWYVACLGAVERFRMAGPGGHGIMHAELGFGGQTLMLSDANPQWGTAAPDPAAPAAVKIMLYVADVDAVVGRCEAAGGRVVMAPQDQFWGDRMGEIRDPFGHAWVLASHVEDVPEAEMTARAKAFFEAPA